MSSLFFLQHMGSPKITAEVEFRFKHILLFSLIQFSAHRGHIRMAARSMIYSVLLLHFAAL